MSKEDMMPWAQRAFYNDHYASVSPTGEYPNDLDAAEEYHKSLAKIGDILTALDNHGFSNLGSMDALRKTLANMSTSMGFPGGAHVAGMDEKTASAIRTLDQEVDYAQGLLSTHPALLLKPGESGAVDLRSFKPFGTELPDVGGSTAIKDAAFSGLDLKTKLRMLNTLQAKGDDRYQDLINQGSTQWVRVAPKHDANVLQINDGKRLRDRGNDYYSGTYASYPGDPQTVAKEDYKAFAKAHPNTQFMTKGPNAKLMTTPQ
jgi:hypothetical protein